MNKGITKRLVSIFIIFGVIFTTVFSGVGCKVVEAAAAPCLEYTGGNVEGQDYDVYAKPVYSYMTSCADGKYMLVEMIDDSSVLSVQYYDAGFNFISNKEVSLELPMFGAFYETSSNYYILSGQSNYEESNSVEVFRVTKYDKNWKKISHCSLYGANTTVPFAAGSARMASVGDYLLIRTSHQMYKGSDGLRHQANVTIQIKMSTMKVTDSYTKVMNSMYGYVSHSFNQFIQIENNKIVAVDHGDAYPRAIILLKYPTAVTSGKFTPTYSNPCDNTWLIDIDGEIGANYTGVSIGAFEISDTAYLVAGNQDINGKTMSYADYEDGRNIFVASMSKSTGAVSYKKITNYAAGEEIASTPHMTKIGTNSYMLLWHKGDKVYYTKLDGNGNKVGSIYSMEGNLSDCKPILSSGKLIWYVRDEQITRFYTINTSNMTNSVKTVVIGHDYVYGNVVTDGTINKTCKKCGMSGNVTVPTDYYCFWNNSGEYWDYDSTYDSLYSVGDKVICWPYMYGDYDMRDMEVFSSNQNVITINEMDGEFELNCVGTGFSTITVRPKYNPTLKYEFIFRVGEEGAFDINDATFSKPEDKVYAGYSQEQDMVITYKGYTLDYNDYTITYENNVNIGTATMTITGNGLFQGTKVMTYEIKPRTEGGYDDGYDDYYGESWGSYGTSDVNVSYRTHIQTFGWEYDWNKNGAMSGTTGLAKRLEGIRIKVDPTIYGGDLDLGIRYTTHCQSYGWLPWSADGDMSGTEGEAKRLEAIMIQLTGEDAKDYDVYYRVHAQTYGWLGWAANGAPAGTAGYGKRLEGIQIIIVKKGESFDRNAGGIMSVYDNAFEAKPGNSPVVNYPATSNEEPVVPGGNEVNVAYRTHIQTYGWQGWKYNGQMSGTSGLAKRLEAIEINITNKDYEGGVAYATHVQTYGWQGVDLDDPNTWSLDGDIAGTLWEAKRLEAICITLTGEMAEHYDIYYRVHAQTYGWLGWAKNGAPAGTAGYAKRLEGIQIVVVPKGSGEPDTTYMGVTSINESSYIEK